MSKRSNALACASCWSILSRIPTRATMRGKPPCICCGTRFRATTRRFWLKKWSPCATLRSGTTKALWRLKAQRPWACWTIVALCGRSPQSALNFLAATVWALSAFARLFCAKWVLACARLAKTVVSDLFLRCLEQHAWPYCEELADWAPKNLGKSQKKRLEKIPADHTRIRALLESRELQEVLRAAQSATPTAPSAPAKRAANLAQPQPAAAKRPAGASSSETVAHEAYLTASPSAPLGNSDRPTPSRGRRL